MNEKELFDFLQTLNIPVAYDHFEQTSNKKISPPFIVYRNDEPLTKKAEDVTWYMKKDFIVELATVKKDVELETSLENLFTNNDLAFDKEEIYIEEEQMFQIRYYII